MNGNPTTFHRPTCFRIKRTILLSAGLLSIAGCAPYARVQVDLIDQSRQGIANALAADVVFTASADQLLALHRQRLDAGFDADLRDQPTLSIDWLITHRQAYAAAIDALADRKAATHQQRLTAASNLQAIDQALAQLRYLQTLPLSWFSKPSP